MDPKLQAAADFDTVGVSTSYVVPLGKLAKGCRIDQAGEVTFKSQAGTEDVWNCLQGELINLGGRIEITTDSSAIVKVYL